VIIGVLHEQQYSDDWERDPNEDASEDANPRPSDRNARRYHSTVISAEKNKKQ
jgi:hypothetical protein